MKKIVLAFDSFKGCMSSIDVARKAKKAVLGVFPRANISTVAIADGGEGFMQALSACMKVSLVKCRVLNPIMHPIIATYAITEDKHTAIMELASAAGLTLLHKKDRNPMLTTSFGVGEMIADAMSRGCRDFIIGLGSSATNDAGTGMLSALGIKFKDARGNVLYPITGSELYSISDIDESDTNPCLKECHFTFACDVNNPFCGRNGAACVYASQKGADAHEVEVLDSFMDGYAHLIHKVKGMDITHVAGAGAAGGIGGGVLPFLNAELKSGINIILDANKFDTLISDADMIITGEGNLDNQTAMGKAPIGILNRAKKQNIPVYAIGGRVKCVRKLINMGFADVVALPSASLPLSEAMQPLIAGRNIYETVKEIMLHHKKQNQTPLRNIII